MKICPCKTSPIDPRIVKFSIGGILVPIQDGRMDGAGRKEQVRGSFYPEDVEEVGGFLAALAEKFPPHLEKVGALLVPHAGYAYSAVIAAEAYAQLRGIRMGRIFILGDNHRREWLGRGMAVPNFEFFQSFDKKIPVDGEFCASLRAQFPHLVMASEEAFHGHVIEVQLPMLQHFANLSDARLIPLIFQGLETDEVDAIGQFLAAQWRDGDLLILSSDLSHYLPAAMAEARDRQTLGHILCGRFPGGDNCLCGPLALRCLQAAIRALRLVPHFLAQSHSGKTGGDFSRVVGYGSLAWTANPLLLSPQVFHILADLAMETIRSALTGGALPDVEPLEGEFFQLRARQSVFVTLEKGGELRGCIGSLGDVSRSIAAGVRHYALEAAFHDSRFLPVRAEELPHLEPHISILSFPQRLHLSPEHWGAALQDRNPKPGVILEIAGSRSTFLPEVWEQLPLAEDFLNALCRKQGRNAGDWRLPEATLETYETQRSVRHSP
jgi:AmmeMemoRadiSam system protein B/AmmeMemoRadiSam system protein A